MSISFLLGRTGTGKTTRFLQEIIEKAARDPLGKPIIYLVPDQMTFQSEMQLIQSKQIGMTRVQVLSFSRLALRVLQETGGISRYHIQKTGINMLLRKIVEKEKGNFTLFAKTTDTNGFIDQLEQMVSELKRYNVSADNLQEQYESLKNNLKKRPQEQVLQEKLHDIQLVFQKLELELANTYVGSEDYLRLLAEKICKSNYLLDAEIYIDGFHSFTPLELNVLEQLFTHCAQKHFALTIDRAYELEERLNELDLFFETARTYQELLVVCKSTNVKVEQTIVLTDRPRFRALAIRHLEENFDIRPAKVSEQDEGIHIIGAVHRRSEAEGVAREILHLVRDKNYRFQDMAILLRNLGDYVDLLDTVFTDYEIPLFMDQKRSMLNHPVIEFIRSSLEVIHGHWRYESVFRCLKTDMLFPLTENVTTMRERVDQLENYVLSYGIQGSRWYQKEPWTYRRVRTSADRERGRTAEEERFEREINELRSLLTVPLITLEKGMKRAKTVQDRCEVLYNYLEDCHVPKKIELMRNRSAEDGYPQEAKEHDQVWGSVIDLLDQMVELTGDGNMSFDLFRTVLDTGLESMKFSIIPPAIDQVIVADMEHSRLSNVRCAFILGINEGVLPAKPDEGGIVSEEERESLQKEGLSLAPSSTRKLLNENFLIYMAKCTPSDRLYLTYPLADDEGKSLQPSIILKRVKDMFPQLEEQLWFHEPTDMPNDEQINFIHGPRKTLSYLTYELQAWKKGYPVPEYWWDTYNWFVGNEDWHLQVKRVLHSLFYENKAKPLSREMSQTLYGNELQTSVSRMEQFQSCPFAQYANYGLSLRDRETYKLEAPDIGTLFHAALKEMAEHLRKNGKDFSQLTKAECAALAKEIVAGLAPKIQREILLSSNRYNYIKQKLEEVVARASSVLAEQSKSSGFSPVGLEVAFGPNEDLPPLQFQLDNGSKLQLVGRIDRVDKSEGSDGLLLRVIDYKSSKKDVQLTDVYYGLSLQMLIYLDVVISFSEKWLGAKASPAGVLYFHVHNPLLQRTEKLTLDQIEVELFKEFKMKGLIQANPEVARLMDYNLETGGRSNIIPAAIKESGEFYKDSSVISDEDYNALRRFLRKKVEEIGTAITDGKIDITPVKNKQHVACTFCSFKPVCQFDPTLETNDYRRVGKLKKEEVLNKIHEEGGEEDED